MKRYWFALVNEAYEDLGAFIPDGSNKKTAVNRAKRWMQENGVSAAELQVNSMITNNILEFIPIEIQVI